MDYKDILENVGIIRLSLSVVSVRGDTALDYLNRMSTNDLLSLPVNHQRTTILTNEKGRVIDIVNVLRRPEEIILIGSEGDGTVLESWLKRFVIMENIEIKNISSDLSIIAVFGKMAGDFANILEEKNSSDSEESITTTTIDGLTITIFAPAVWQKRVCYIYSFQDNVETTISGIRTPLPDNITLVPTTMEIFETYRIESGIPKLGHELTPNINPLEAGLDSFVSFTKGCYIGQEVIARLDTYKKLQKHIVGIAIGSHEMRDKYIGELFLKGKAVGFTTSSCFSPFISAPIALGYLSTSVTQDAMELRCVDQSSIPVAINKLPFR
jgi:folate-binding protein YgfZ